MVTRFFSVINPVTAVKSVLLFIMLMSVPVFSMAAKIQVTTDRNPVSLNESFQLVYKSSDSVDGDPDFSPLEKYLDVLNRSQSSNVSLVNGNYSSSKTWTLSVMPRQQGVIVLPAIKFGSDLSDSITITIKQAANNQQGQAGFYTRIRVDHEQVYAQQQLVVTQQLFSDQNLSAYGMGELDFNDMDVVVQRLGEEKQYKTRIGDKAFLVIERSYAVFPQVSGLLKISPVLAEAQIGSLSSSIFNGFGRNKIARARSNAMQVNVLPVPENSNVNPWLPAKKFQLLEQWPESPPKFVQGEPVTRTLSIKAEGLTAAQLPELPEIANKNLKQYPDQPLLNDITNDSGITGYRVEKVALIPTTAGEMTLPAIDIPWWNTDTQSREVAHIPARNIQVEATAEQQIPSTTLTPVEKVFDEHQNEVEEQQQIEKMEEVAYWSSNLWVVLAILFALAWVTTIMAWLISIRNKKQDSTSVSTVSSTSLKKAFKQLKRACVKQDIAECRSSLLEWSQVLFTQETICNLADLTPYIPDEMNSEIKNIDAVLYGQKDSQINFTLILDQAAGLMQTHKNKSRHSKAASLEPLYKSVN